MRVRDFHGNGEVKGRAREGGTGFVDYTIDYGTICGKGVGRGRAGLGPASGIFDAWLFGFGGLLRRGRTYGTVVEARELVRTKCAEIIRRKLAPA